MCAAAGGSQNEKLQIKEGATDPGCSRAPGRPVALSSDPREQGYPGGTAGDNPGDDGGNPEIRIPLETKDAPQYDPRWKRRTQEEEKHGGAHQQRRTED
ncbi:hypothetical protein NDU88_001774 [Pleurodeles waltl]|uniref:Uncharacterized protein n=1 Tax=Pleurodeles waltl TaxID=8319 RepID=A0AAV7WNR3_PLEWA|nr:hypothetical protein NDU88_001774 [Pleurodeles waltl]